MKLRFERIVRRLPNGSCVVTVPKEFVDGGMVKAGIRHLFTVEVQDE